MRVVGYFTWQVKKNEESKIRSKAWSNLSAGLTGMGSFGIKE